MRTIDTNLDGLTTDEALLVARRRMMDEFEIEIGRLQFELRRDQVNEGEIAEMIEQRRDDLARELERHLGELEAWLLGQDGELTLH